ncbi:DNA-3-methyladenine glycosylase 2 family protein, partial [Streptomyces sp. SID14478]|uniref:AlkA N-terminal domain-containing protein n=1 Tax=Streptomyces sp. SID14478 TaxID=2706073 RepID=UPI0014119399
LAHRGDYPAGPVFDLLGQELLEGIEELSGEPGTRMFRRTLRLPYGTGIVSVDEAGHEQPGAQAEHRGGWLDARIHLTDLRDLTTAVGRLRRLFDLDSDPFAIDERLGADPRLAPLVAARPGLRSPGAADPDELAVRLLVGPAESARLVERYGKRLDAPCGA